MNRRTVVQGAVLFAVMGLQHHCRGGPGAAQAADGVRKPIAGTLTEFRVNSLEVGVKTDEGEVDFFSVGPDTEVVQIPPGEHDLKRGKTAKVTDLACGDRILVSFVTGLS